MAVNMRYDGNGWTQVISDGSEDRGREEVTPSSNTASSSPTTVGDNKVSENAQKEYIELERNILVGDVVLREAKPKLKAKQTIRLEGFGKILSGLFFVEKVTNVFGNNGYTQTVTVRRNGFGDSMKKAMVSVAVPAPVAPTKVPAVSPPVQQRTYVVVKGDSLSKIASKYGTTWQKIYEANRSVVGSNPNLIYPGQKLLIP